MEYSHNGMAQGHPGAGKPHYAAYLFPFLFSVAMNSTFGANRFFIFERAFFKPFIGIIYQFAAVIAKGAAMVQTAIQLNHLIYGQPFALAPAFKNKHDCKVVKTSWKLSCEIIRPEKFKPKKFIKAPILLS